eukprot:TRINITY_DN38320_c0_g1_i1.p1 TRINITY_DN38320_c0_g1~~TRINITY_DN38320_c0_g1_i1.p1  ORF type:complete len:474 (+),score=64.38 TRINITY_DN38320_c0_g1_i1:76-1497(+)
MLAPLPEKISENLVSCLPLKEIAVFRASCRHQAAALPTSKAAWRALTAACVVQTAARNLQLSLFESNKWRGTFSETLRDHVVSGLERTVPKLRGLVADWRHVGSAACDDENTPVDSDISQVFLFLLCLLTDSKRRPGTDAPYLAVVVLSPFLSSDVRSFYQDNLPGAKTKQDFDRLGPEQLEDVRRKLEERVAPHEESDAKTDCGEDDVSPCAVDEYGMIVKSGPLHQLLLLEKKELATTRRRRNRKRPGKAVPAAPAAVGATADRQPAADAGRNAQNRAAAQAGGGGGGGGGRPAVRPGNNDLVGGGGGGGPPPNLGAGNAPPRSDDGTPGGRSIRAAAGDRLGPPRADDSARPAARIPPNMMMMPMGSVTAPVGNGGYIDSRSMQENLQSMYDRGSDRPGENDVPSPTFAAQPFGGTTYAFVRAPFGAPLMAMPPPPGLALSAANSRSAAAMNADIPARMPPPWLSDDDSP